MHAHLSATLRIIKKSIQQPSKGGGENEDADNNSNLVFSNAGSCIKRDADGEGGKIRMESRVTTRY